jgi:hypothetical protein
VVAAAGVNLSLLPSCKSRQKRTVIFTYLQQRFQWESANGSPGDNASLPPPRFATEIDVCHRAHPRSSAASGF